LYVLAAPASVKFDVDGSALPITAVAGVVASALGVAPPTEFAWDGLYAGNLFDRPLAAATIVVAGMSSIESAGVVPTYSLIHDEFISVKTGVSAVVSGHVTPGFPALASLVAEASGQTSVCISVSADSNAAMASSHRDLTTNAVEHTIYRHGGSFTDSAVNDAPIPFTDFSVDFLVGASFDQASWKVSYGGVEFPESATAFFQELKAMVEVAAALPKTKATTQAPAVLTFTITSYADVVKTSGRGSKTGQAAKAAVESVIQTITGSVNTAYNGKAVVLAVALETAAAVAAKSRTEVVGGFSIVEHIQQHKLRKRRATVIQQLGFASQGMNRTNRTDTPECNRFRCACVKAFAPGLTFDGQYWAPITKAAEDGKGAQEKGCLKNVDATPGQCYELDQECNTICASDPRWCPCNEPNFDPTYLAPMMMKAFTCTGCDLGYKLSDGECYLLEEQASANFNIALWTGLMATAGVSGIWYALHTIDSPMYSAVAGGGGDVGKFKDM
jgi:hypothetical protein